MPDLKSISLLVLLLLASLSFCASLQDARFCIHHLITGPTNHVGVQGWSGKSLSSVVSEAGRLEHRFRKQSLLRSINL